MKKIILAVMLIGLLSLGVFASDYKGALPEINLPLGAAAIGQGGAVVASSSDQMSVYWNPAGLTKLMKKEFTATLSANMDYDRSSHYLGYAQKLKNGLGVGIGILRSELTDIPMVDANGNITGSDDYTSNIVYLSAGKEYEDIRFGATIKILDQDIAGASSESGFGFDIGLQYALDKKIEFGTILKNIGTQIGDGDVDMVLQSGIAYKVNSIFALEFDFGRNFEKENSFIRTGCVLSLAKDKFKIRAGLDDGELMFGTSFVFDQTKKKKNYSIGLDYAFVSEQEDIFDDSHRISIDVKF